MSVQLLCNCNRLLSYFNLYAVTNKAWWMNSKPCFWLQPDFIQCFDLCSENWCKYLIPRWKPHCVSNTADHKLINVLCVSLILYFFLYFSWENLFGVFMILGLCFFVRHTHTHTHTHSLFHTHTHTHRGEMTGADHAKLLFSFFFPFLVSSHRSKKLFFPPCSCSSFSSADSLWTSSPRAFSTY